MCNGYSCVSTMRCIASLWFKYDVLLHAFLSTCLLLPNYILFMVFNILESHFLNRYKQISTYWSRIECKWCFRPMVHMVKRRDDQETRGMHSIVKLYITCVQKKSTFSKLDHQNGSIFFPIFFMSRYTWYLIHSKKW